jgi:hypothetical protein
VTPRVPQKNMVNETVIVMIPAVITLTTVNAVCYALAIKAIAGPISSGLHGFPHSGPHVRWEIEHIKTRGMTLMMKARSLFMAAVKLSYRIGVCCVILLILSGCALAPKSHSHHAKPARRQQPKPVDVKAQQRYYDLGLQHYSKEHYRDAKRSFQEVVELGPNTVLGLKAQENLKKIQQILKTLEEIESK